MHKRVALFGDGSLSLDVGTRDGSIPDRRELFRGFESLGWEPLYLALPHKSPGDDRVVGWEWRGRADLLVIEVRTLTRAPSKLDGSGTDPFSCALHQWWALRDWLNGAFGEGCRLGVVDFDLNARKVFGLGAKGSGEGGAAFIGAVGGRDLRDEIVAAVRERATFFVPWDPSLAKGLRPGLKIVRWLWPYPSGAVNEPLDRDYDLIYAGSDYGRRYRFATYYGAAAQAGWRVATTGSWTSRNKGSFGGKVDERYKGTDFKAAMASQGVDFVGRGKTLPYSAVADYYRRSRATVQIAPEGYERLGYYTARMAEACAHGCLPFVDSNIAAHDEIVPDPWFRVSSFGELAAKLEAVRGREGEGVEAWRAHLRSVVGDGARAAERLIEECGVVSFHEEQSPSERSSMSIDVFEVKDDPRWGPTVWVAAVGDSGEGEAHPYIEGAGLLSEQEIGGRRLHVSAEEWLDDLLSLVELDGSTPTPAERAAALRELRYLTDDSFAASCHEDDAEPFVIDADTQRRRDEMQRLICTTDRNPSELAPAGFRFASEDGEIVMRRGARAGADEEIVFDRAAIERVIAIAAMGAVQEVEAQPRESGESPDEFADRVHRAGVAAGRVAAGL